LNIKVSKRKREGRRGEGEERAHRKKGRTIKKGRGHERTGARQERK
jgi:hypothetical protein